MTEPNIKLIDDIVNNKKTKLSNKKTTNKYEFHYDENYSSSSSYSYNSNVSDESDSLNESDELDKSDKLDNFDKYTISNKKYVEKMEIYNKRFLLRIKKKELHKSLRNINFKKECTDYSLYDKPDSYIKTLVKKFNFKEPSHLILISKPNFINDCDIRYFSSIKNISLLLLHAEKMTESKLLEIGLNLYRNNDKDTIIKTLIYVFSNKNRLIKLSNKGKFLIEFMINIIDENNQLSNYYTIYSKDYLKDNITINFDNIKINFEKIKNNFQFTKTNLQFFLDTTDSKTILYFINKFKQKDIINSLSNILSKDKIIITEKNIYDILYYYKKKKSICYKFIMNDTDLIEGLIKHDFLICLEIFNNTKLDFIPSKDFIKKILLLEKKELEKLFENIQIKDIINEYFLIWDVILSDNKLTDVAISKNYRIPSEYFEQTFSIKNIIYSNIDKHRTFNNILKINNTNKKFSQEEKHKLVKNYIQNIKKFNIPINDILACNFFEYYSIDEIIKYYHKNCNAENIIPFLLYNKKYDIIDKMMETNIIDKKEYCRKFDSYTKKFVYYGANKIGKIIQVYKENIKRYNFNFKNKLVNIALKHYNYDVIKYIIRTYKSISISANKIKNIIANSKKSYYRTKKYMNCLDFIKKMLPLIKNKEILFKDQLFIEEVLYMSTEIKFEDIIEIKKNYSDFKISFERIINKLQHSDIIVMFENCLKEYSDNTLKESDKLFYTEDIQKIIFSYMNDINFDNKYIDIINKYYKEFHIEHNIYEVIYNNFYNAETIIKVYEQLGKINYDPFTISCMICMGVYEDEFMNIIEKFIKKCPQIKYKTHNFIKDCLENCKNKIKNLKGKSKYYKDRVYRYMYFYQRILEFIKPENIIYENNPLYNIKPNNLSNNWVNIKADLDIYLFNNNYAGIVKTDNNNIIDEI